MTINQQEADKILKALHALRRRIWPSLYANAIGELYFTLAERYAKCGYDCANLQKRPTINHNETDRKSTTGTGSKLAHGRRRTKKRVQSLASRRKGHAGN